MKQNKIFIIVKKPGGNPEIRLVDGDLKTFTAITEGKREIIPFPEMPGICIVFDGQAAAGRKKPNFFLPKYDDLLLGTVMFVGINLETGFISLTEDQADKLEQYIRANDAAGFTGDVEKKVRTEYLPSSDENSVYSFLSESKTKYKSIKVKWLSKR